MFVRGYRIWAWLMTMALLFAPLAALAEGPVAPIVPVTKVQFTRESGSLAVNASYNLNALLRVLPLTATDRQVAWTSGDPTVATVTDEGVVTMLRDGAVRIQAASKSNPQLYDSIKLTGVAVRVKTIRLSQTRVVVNAGEDFTLTCAVAPSNASFAAVSWTSDSPHVATVDGQGKVTAVGPGRAIITATTDLGRASARMGAYVRGGAMKTVKISSMGDTVLGGDKKKVSKADGPIGDGLTSWLRFQKFYNESGPAYFLAGVRDVLAADDLSIVNFEGTLTEATKAAKKTYAFKGKPDYAQILQLGSVEVASLANNHSEDYFAKGFSDTKKYLKRAGVTPIGFGYGGAAARTVNGVRVGFAGFCVPVSRATISSTINRLEKSCDIVIAQFHWAHSKEWTNQVTSEERSLARYAIAKGADLVVGHHKHQVSGIERYLGKMIAYDVGNFVAMIRTKIGSRVLDKASMIYQQKFNVFEDGYVEVCDPNIVPIMISDNQDALTGNPHVSTGEEAERVLSLVRRYSPYTSAGLVRYDPNY